MDEQALTVLLRVTEVFDKFAIPYVIGGSFASSFHGLLRMTNDVDIVAVIREEQTAGLATEFANDFYVDAEMISRAVRQKSSFNMLHFDTTFKADVFIAKPGFQEQEIARRQLKKLGTDTDYAFYFSTPEDIILAKLDWYRKGNYVANQQWRDIASVIRVQGAKLDIEYMRRWAGALGLSDLLEQALEESLNE